MSYFEYYETKADGTPSEVPRRIAYEDRRILFLRWRWSRVDMQHFINIACLCPGVPVDVTHWEEEQGERRMIYSARLTYKVEGLLSLKSELDRQFGQPHHGHDAEENAPLDRTAARLIKNPQKDDY